MAGGCSFREALSQRLEMIQPSKKLVSEYLKLHPPRLTPGIKSVLSSLYCCNPFQPALLFKRELVKTLHARDSDVYLVSGGFDTLIEPVAKELGIPVRNIYANKLKFYFDGTSAARVLTACTHTLFHYVCGACLT